MANIVDNRKARFNYEILEEYEAGIELLGIETPAVRRGRLSLDGSHVTVRGGEAFLIGAAITPLQPKNAPKDYDERRNRKLLMKKSELLELGKKGDQKGLTLVALSFYNKGRKIKVKVALVRGKKQFDKRASLKKREDDRDVQRTLKTQY